MGAVNKKILIFVLIIIIASLSFFYFSAKEKKNNSLVVILDYGQSKRSFRLVTKDKEMQNAWSLLQQATAFANIPLEAKNEFYPKRIDGHVDGENNKHWVYYLDGKKQDSSPMATFVQPPAEIIFRYE